MQVQKTLMAGGVRLSPWANGQTGGRHTRWTAAFRKHRIAHGRCAESATAHSRSAMAPRARDQARCWMSTCATSQTAPLTAAGVIGCLQARGAPGPPTHRPAAMCSSSATARAGRCARAATRPRHAVASRVLAQARGSLWTQICEPRRSRARWTGVCAMRHTRHGSMASGLPGHRASTSTFAIWPRYVAAPRVVS